MQIAKDRSWTSISGVEAMIEQGLAQQYLWQNVKTFGPELEGKVRDFIQAM